MTLHGLVEGENWVTLLNVELYECLAGQGPSQSLQQMHGICGEHRNPNQNMKLQF